MNRSAFQFSNPENALLPIYSNELLSSKTISFNPLIEANEYSPMYVTDAGINIDSSL